VAGVRSVLIAAALLVPWTGFSSEPVDVSDRVEHGYAESAGVKIHYASLGEGPLVVMIHRFPDFWYTWRHQMEALRDEYRVVAIDQRGYNRSDKPAGQESYDLSLRIDDVKAVIDHLGVAGGRSHPGHPARGGSLSAGPGR